jgi:hypothetical protein
MERAWETDPKRPGPDTPLGTPRLAGPRAIDPFELFFFF